jgi:hypothetical protein
MMVDFLKVMIKHLGLLKIEMQMNEVHEVQSRDKNGAKIIPVKRVPPTRHPTFAN